MLKKVEKQKRLLLQEFGANLPNDIFNASIKSLFEKDKSVQTQLPVQDICIQKSLSPEIKVINASYDEDIKDKTEEKKDLSVKKVEIAVQTITVDKDSIAQDKSTQVQLISQKENESVFVNDEIKTITKHYPIEPRITIIRHEMDSNNSTSSETINAITDVDESNNQSLEILKKKKYNTKIKQTPPKMFHKSCSTRTSKTSSPVKKYSKFLSRSQYSSQKKSLCTEDMPSKKIKMYVDKNGFNIKVKPQITDITVDVNSQSTQVYSTKSKEEAMSKQQWVQSTSKRIKMKDISDTSTSFASLPSVKPKEIFEALHNNISILEMLDSSANESIRRLRKDISPVSTPDTPSPRTMMMPSNIPHLDRIKKLLRYSSTDSQTNDNDTLFSKNDNSTSIDSSEYQQNDCLPSSKNNDIDLKIPISLGFCLCDNLECKQTHAKFDEIRNYALKNCPQILQKYEDLQTTCAERIISLTNLIEKVRNEQKGILFSLIIND